MSLVLKVKQGEQTHYFPITDVDISFEYRSEPVSEIELEDFDDFMRE